MPTRTKNVEMKQIVANSEIHLHHEKLYEKFLKRRTILNKEKYKADKNLFELIKGTSK